MRKFLIVCIGLLLVCSFAFASEEIVKDEAGNITKYIIKVELTPEEYKAMASDCYSVDEWVTNCVKAKAEREMNKIVEKFSNRQAKKISNEEKRAIVREANVESAKTRQDRFIEELKNRTER